MPRSVVVARCLTGASIFLALAGVPGEIDAATKGGPSQQNVAKAEKAYKKALELYRSGQYRAAIDKLKEARTLDPTAKELPYNLGLVYEKLGELDDAIKWFGVYVTMETDEEERERVKAAIRRLEGARADLQHAPAEASASASTAPPPPPAASTSKNAPPAPSEHGRFDAWTIGAGSLAIVAAAAGTYFGLHALSTSPSHPVTGTTTSITSLEQQAKDAHTSAVYADVSFAVAAVAAGAALYLYFGRDAERSPSSASVVPLPGGALGSMEVSF